MKAKENVRSVLVALAVAACAWAVIALFFPVKLSDIAGTLDSGRAYQTTETTYGFNSVGGYLLLLCGFVDVVVSLALFRRKYGPLKALFWAGFTVFLTITYFFVGLTPIVSWLLNIPPEVQHAFGSEYATLVERGVTNWPAIASIGFSGMYVVGVVVVWMLERKQD